MARRSNANGEIPVRVLNTITDFFYPPLCVQCHQLLPEQATAGDLPEVRASRVFCDRCLHHIPPVPANMCQRCGAPLGPFVNAEQNCVHCRKDKFSFESVIALGVYENEFRDVVLQAKHESQLPLVAGLVTLIWQRYANRLQAWSPDVIVPIPNHWTSRLTSPNGCPGNLADQLSKRLGIPVSRGVLRKVKRTASQAQLSPTERRKNLRNVFKAKSSRSVAGKTVMLVDDVLTTGSTAHEASRVLKNAGAKAVFVTVLARGLGVYS